MYIPCGSPLRQLIIPHPDIRIWICPPVATLAELDLSPYSWRRKSKGFPERISPPPPWHSPAVCRCWLSTLPPYPLCPLSHPSLVELLQAGFSCFIQWPFTAIPDRNSVLSRCLEPCVVPTGHTLPAPALTWAVGSTSLQILVSLPLPGKLRWTQIIFFSGHFFEDWLVTWNCDHYQLSSCAMQKEFPTILPSDVCQYVFNSSLLHIKYSKRCKAERNE